MGVNWREPRQGTENMLTHEKDRMGFQKDRMGIKPMTFLRVHSGTVGTSQAAKRGVDDCLVSPRALTESPALLCVCAVASAEVNLAILNVIGLFYLLKQGLGSNPVNPQRPIPLMNM